jgi:hypothetical protein
MIDLLIMNESLSRTVEGSVYRPIVLHTPPFIVPVSLNINNEDSVNVSDSVPYL